MFPLLAVGAGEALSVDPDRLDDEALGAALVALHRVDSMLAAARARLTAAFEARQGWAADGSRTPAAWLARHCHVPDEAARAEVRFARRLRTMPATTDALAAGEVTVHHARRLSALNRPEVADAFADSEPMLVGQARNLTWAHFTRTTNYWLQLAQPDQAEDDASAQEAARRVHMSPGMDGTGLLDGLLTPLGYATVRGALDRIENELFHADWAEARARLGDRACLDDLARTPAQRRHDALVEMAERAIAAPADSLRPRPLVTVLVGLETFTGRICELADGTVISPGTIAGLLDRATIERVVFDSPDRVMAVGTTRLFTGALRRAIEVRDRHCTHPGCTVPAARCDVDHVIPYNDGGPTNQANGVLRCPAHHRWRHQQDRHSTDDDDADGSDFGPPAP
jgi:hypothetical protein